ncbi:Pre-rRNA-processing protein esf2 [Aspergillus aurantiobrunneus]
MTTRKRNEFLDIASSDDEDNDAGYDSEAAEESKGRITKRRKTQSRDDGLDSGSDGEESDGEEGEESSDEEAGGVRLSKKREQRQANSQSVSGDDKDPDEEAANEYEGGQLLDVSGETDKGKESKTKKTTKPLDKLKPKPSKKNKTGVVYFSSLPPYLKPFALKSLLETRGFAPITKVFLTPEVRPPSAPRRRSNKRKSYTDGWVEFASKKTAKICAETLNASIVGGRKGGWYHDDVWSMKYLKGFKWSDLMDQVQREKSERDAKRRIEDARARKEEKVFLQGHEKGKMLDGIQKKNEEKRRRKMQAGGDEGGREEAVNVRRLFKQNEVKLGRDKVQDDQGALEDDTRRVLGKIF